MSLQWRRCYCPVAYIEVDLLPCTSQVLWDVEARYLPRALRPMLPAAHALLLALPRVLWRLNRALLPVAWQPTALKFGTAAALSLKQLGESAFRASRIASAALPAMVSGPASA